MNGGMYILVQCLTLFLDVISIAMLARAVLSWFSQGEQTRLGAFLYVVTEPVIQPVRHLCGRLGWFQGTPFDMPFLITMVLMSFISLMLQASIA